MIRTIAIIGLLMPTTVMADHYLKNGSYFCERFWNQDGEQQASCLTKSGMSYSCLGHPIELSEKGMVWKTKGGDHQFEKIAETDMVMDDGKEHLASIVLIRKNDEGRHEPNLATINFVHGTKNVVHLKYHENHAASWWAGDIESETLKERSVDVMTLSFFSRCEFIE